MRRSILFAGLLGLVFAFPAVAQAQIVAKINLSTQRMEVYVDGSPRYRWPVSTAQAGYRTPTGTFTPTALVRYHRSTIYSWIADAVFDLLPARLRDTRLLRDEISRAPRLAWLHQTASLQRRRALFTGAAAWRREHRDQDQLLAQCSQLDGAGAPLKRSPIQRRAGCTLSLAAKVCVTPGSSTKLTRVPWLQR